MRLIARALITVCVVGAGPGAGAASQLQVSPQRHFFEYRGKVLLLVGDSGTQCVMQNPNIDYRRWIDDCEQAGLNAVHIWSFVAPRQQLDGSVVEPRYGYVYPGITPWARKTEGGRAYDGGRQWDLHRWDEGADPSHYWPRLRDLCGYAKEKGLIVGITVFWGWPKHSRDWVYHPFNVENGGPVTDLPSPHATQVQRIHSPGVEVASEPWSADWPAAKKVQWHWEQFARKLINETAVLGNVFYVFMDEHSYSEGNGGDHFLHFFKSRGCVWVDWDARREAVDAVFAPVSFRPDTGKNRGAVAAFSRNPARPFLILEGGPYQGEDVRVSIWTALVGGAHVFFHNDEGMETVHTGIMGYDPNVSGGDTGAERRCWMGHASRFFNEALSNLDAMAPRNDLASGAFCMAAPGREYAAYAPPQGSGVVALDLRDAPGVVRSRFYDPRTGEWRPEQRDTGGAWLTFSKPSRGDWALHVMVSKPE